MFIINSTYLHRVCTHIEQKLVATELLAEFNLKYTELGDLPMTNSQQKCPFLKLSDIDNKPAGHAAPVAEYTCYASSPAFIPTNVHQSSCCLNPSNYVRCSYYMATPQAENSVSRPLTSRSAFRPFAWLSAPLKLGRRKRKRKIFY